MYFWTGCFMSAYIPMYGKDVLVNAALWGSIQVVDNKITFENFKTHKEINFCIFKTLELSF